MPQVFLVSITHQIHCSCGCTWEGFTKFNCSIIVFWCQIVAEMHSKKKFAHLLGTRAQDLLNSIKTQHDFRVRLTEIPSWGSPLTYGDVISAAATEVGARELARGGERGLAKAPCLGPCTPCIPCIQAPCLGRRMLERYASTKYVHCTFIFSFWTGGIFSPTCPSLCSWYWVFNNLTLHFCVLATLWYWSLHWGSGLWLVQRWYNMQWIFLYLLHSYSGAKACRWLA